MSSVADCPLEIAQIDAPDGGPNYYHVMHRNVWIEYDDEAGLLNVHTKDQWWIDHVEWLNDDRDDEDEHDDDDGDDDDDDD